MKNLRRLARLLGSLCLDGVHLYLPWTVRARHPYAIAFLVHPRDRRDMVRKYSFLRHTPEWFIQSIEHYLWPITVSSITGLRDSEGNSIPGFVISIPMTAATMLNHRKRALHHIRQAVYLARNKGARIVGLGALTSSLSGGGTKLTDISDIAVTTGHAYTGYSVTANLFQIIQDYRLDMAVLTVGIVGAAGSIGSISAHILARAGVGHVILIDIERKQESLATLRRALEETHRYDRVTVANNLSTLHRAHFVITATNTPDALIRPEHVTPGTVIIDDAQPSDVSGELFRDPDVMVIEAGAVTTPGVSANFPMGLHGIDTNYCCMAELLILGSERRTTNHTIARATLEQVDALGARGALMHFHVAPYQNEFGIIPTKSIEHVISLLRMRISA